MGTGPSRDGDPASSPAALKTSEESKGSSLRPLGEVPKGKEVPSKSTTSGESKGSSSGPLVEVPKGKEVLSKSAEVPKELTPKPERLPHMYRAIIKHADEPSDGSLLEKVQAVGIFLNNKKQKYWTDEKTGHNCFMLFARGLSITWSENQQFWQWGSLKETGDVEIEIASLLNVCWLEVHGRFETSYLTPGVIYEVAFVAMMELGYGWAKPVKLRLKLPNGDVKLHEECLLEAPKGKWIELKVGEFMAASNLTGEMEFSLYEYEGGEWKRGLVIKGAVIRPKK